MPATEKTYYEDDRTLVTSSRVLLKHEVRTLLVHEIRDPRLEIVMGDLADSQGLLTRIKWWFTGGVTSRRDLVTVRHHGERVEVDSSISFDGPERYMEEYTPWLGSESHSAAVKQLEHLCAAIGDAIADWATAHRRPAVGGV